MIIEDKGLHQQLKDVVEAEESNVRLEKQVDGSIAVTDYTSHQVLIEVKRLGIDRVVESRGQNRQSAFFYGNEDEGSTTIAEAEDRLGNLYQLITTGEIRVKVDGKIYRNKEIEDLIKSRELTDNDLNSEKIRFINNNWFEVVWQNDEGDRWNSEIGDVAHTYDEAIALLERYVESCYAEPENQSEVTA